MTARAWIARSALAVVVLGGAPDAAAAQDTTRAVRKRTTYEDLQMFSQVLNQIRVNHPDSVDTHELLMAAIAGMVHAADPHSYVVQSIRLSPQKEKEFEDKRVMSPPIGWDFGRGAPVVASVSPGTAASRLDILPGDELILADGKPITAESELELDIVLAGKPGSSATLVFERQRSDGSYARLERNVTRETGDESTAVPAAMLLAPGTGYIRITTFGNAKVADDLHDAIAKLDKLGITQLVLDLRDNGGGLVKEAAQIAGEFLPRGTIVYTTTGRKEEVIDTGRVSRSFFRSERSYPIALLVNAGTASASELVAGALQDHDRAVIVGRPTFGKSLLMQGFPMADGSRFVLVIGSVKTPCGRTIQRAYHGVSRREYYRLARADRDTAGRPACKTDGGRTVYGGGGIYPDVVLPERIAPPVWLARLAEDDVLGRWASAWVTEQASTLSTLEAYETARQLPDAALASFRTFATSAGHTLPADAGARLRTTLLVAVAGAKWGDAGRFRVRAYLDGEVAAAVEALGRAPAILRKPVK